MIPRAHVDVDADDRFQERFWVAERVAWLAMLALVAAAAAGLSGGGGRLSHQTLKTDRGSVDLPRISRWSSADTMTVTVTEPAADTVAVAIPDSFAEAFAIENATPQPQNVTATPAGETYTFAVGGTGPEWTINFSIRAVRPDLNVDVGGFAIDGAKTERATISILP